MSAGRDVDQAELYRLIERAALEQAEDQDELSLAQVEAIAAELGIEPRYVDEARRALAVEKAAASRDARRDRRRWRRVGQIVAVVVAAAVLALLVGRARLSGRFGEVERSAAQMENVVESRARIMARVEDGPRGPELTAELAGAENRVRIERRRYDEAAAAYNTAARGLIGGLCAGLFGFPEAVPMSTEMSR